MTAAVESGGEEGCGDWRKLVEPHGIWRGRTRAKGEGVLLVLFLLSLFPYLHYLGTYLMLCKSTGRLIRMIHTHVYGDSSNSTMGRY